MRSSSHFLRSNPFSSSSGILSSQSICPSCLQLFSTAPQKRGQPSSRRYNSTKPVPPFWQRMRRRIWKDEAPGPENPYDPASTSLIDRRRRVEVEAKQVSEKTSIRADWKNSPEIRQSSKMYQPATTWDGLEHVGYSGHWKERPELVEERFMPYLSGKRVTGMEGLLTAVHRATVEVYTLQGAGRPLTDSSRVGVKDSEEMGSLIGRVEVGMSENGGVRLRYPTDEARDEILMGMEVEEMPDTEVEAEEAQQEGWMSAEDWDRHSGVTPEQDILPSVEESPSPSPEDASITTAAVSTLSTLPIDEDFLAIPLTDAKIKFVILKRAAQLTSHVIPDPTLAKITSLSALLSTLVEISTPKPKNLYETLTATLAEPQHLIQKTDRATSKDARKETSILAALPNVRIYNRRQTPIDKEKMVGRWKVIERELKAKGLPVTGHRDDGHLVKGRWGNGRKQMYYQ